MKYMNQTSKYILKNFFYILPFAIIPAFFLSLSVAEEAIDNVLTATFSGNISQWTFLDLFCAISVLNFGSWKSAVMGIVCVIAIIPCVSLFMAFLEKHMRIGKRTFNGIFSKLNDNFISTFGFGVLFILIYEVWSFLTATLLYFVAMIPSAVGAYVAASFCYLAMHVVLLYAVGAIYLWLPCMQITGFPMLQALQYSHQLLTPVKWGIMGGQIFLLLCAEALIGVCVAFFPNFLVFTLLTTALYTVLLMFYCVRMEIVYFDREQMERMDLRRY